MKRKEFNEMNVFAKVDFLKQHLTADVVLDEFVYLLKEDMLDWFCQEIDQNYNLLENDEEMTK